MAARVRTGLAGEEGFTLIELLVVMIILGVLVAIAVPAYLSFAATAKRSAAESNVRSAIPAAESYYQTNGDSYAGMTGAALRAQAPGFSPHVRAVSLDSGTAYCIEDMEPTSGGVTYDYVGGNPGGLTLTGGQPATIQPGTCLAVTGTAAS
jgi:type IV pilus assembly protein PilA